MGTSWRGSLGCLLALAVALESGPVAAHGGGLDRYGCHRETATNTRHCHNGGTGGEPDDTNYIPTAELGLAIGTWLVVREKERLDFSGAIHVQQDGTVVLTAGVALFYNLSPRGHALYLDVGFGAAIFDREYWYLAVRFTGGLKLPLFQFRKRSSAHLLLGFLVERIADRANAEPAGVHATFGISF